MSVKSIKVALNVHFKLTKDEGFYLDSASDLYIYDRLLYRKFSEIQFHSIRMAYNSKLKVLGKSTVSHTAMIDDVILLVNFFNVLHSLDLKYNLLLFGSIKKANYFVLAKN